MKKRFGKQGNVGLIILFILLIAGGLAFWFKQDIVKMFLSPREKLTLALEKTSKITTLYAKIHSDGTTKLTQTKTGISQEVKFTIDGFLSGSTDGKVSQSEISVSSPLNPSR